MAGNKPWYRIRKNFPRAKTVLFDSGFHVHEFGSVRVLRIFFCTSVLVRFVRFDSHIYINVQCFATAGMYCEKWTGIRRVQPSQLFRRPSNFASPTGPLKWNKNKCLEYSRLSYASSTSSWRSSAGRPFHNLGPATANDRSPKRDCVRRTTQV